MKTVKWCRFQARQHVSFGIVEDDKVTEVAGSPFAEHTVTGISDSLSQVKLLVPNDVIEVEISGIGTLRNYVVAED